MLQQMQKCIKKNDTTIYLFFDFVMILGVRGSLQNDFQHMLFIQNSRQQMLQRMQQNRWKLVEQMFVFYIFKILGFQGLPRGLLMPSWKQVPKETSNDHFSQPMLGSYFESFLPPKRILGDFCRYFGQNKAIVSVFNGSVVYFNVRIGLTFLGRSCSTR